ncbi:MAG: L,D-transpeptidase [Verrucomicrobiota bacterium]|nr:L,D-transpeptidase [Verrucomicrobiota bacterium]
MRHFILLLAIAVLVCGGGASALARKHAGHQRVVSQKKTTAPARPNPAQVEAATRLQVFLDRSNFSPGRLDGHYGGFTLKALALFRQSRGEQPAPPPAKPDTAPDVNGIDLNSFGPAFVPYTVTDADAQMVGPVPAAVPEQAKLKVLPYRDLAEAIAEKFHSDPRFLEELNPGKMKTLKVGDQINVPNVEPFDATRVKEITPGGEVTPPHAANELPDEPESPSPAAGEKPEQQPAPSPAPAAGPVSVKVDVKANIASVFEGDKLIAAYPVTIGSAQTQSPIGDWKVRGVAKLPKFRYDEQMLNHGERSKDFHMLPPGPNNPVGVLWIALNKKGIGLHGTAEPDTIGRSVSHGCVRLANWDIVRLAGRVKFGVAVSIH